MALSRPIMVSRTRRRASRSLRRLIPIALIFIVVLGLLWSVLPVSDVKAIDLRGVTWTNRQEIQVAISQGMSGHAFGVIPKTRWLFASTASMKAALTNISTLSGVNVWKFVPGIITVHVTEPAPWAIVFISGRTYVIGPRGHILGEIGEEEITGISDTAILRGEVLEGAPYGIGENLFIDDRARELDRWNSVLRERGFTPVVWKFTTPHAPDVTISLADGWELRIDPTTDPKTILPQVQRVLDEVVKERKPSLQSLDARSTTALYPRFK